MPTRMDDRMQVWEHVSRRYRLWWDRQADGPLVCFKRCKPPAECKPTRYEGWDCRYGLDTPAEQVIEEFYAAEVENKECYGDAFVSYWPNFGPGMLAVLLGSEGRIEPGTVWFGRIEGADVDTLRIEADFEHPWWRRVEELIVTACQLLPEWIAVGFTDIGGNLDIAASLLGTEQLLVDMGEKPDAVRRIVDAITGVWQAAYARLYELIRRHRPGTTAWAQLWAPGKTYMLQSDFAYMISPQMFDAFVAPDLRSCCRMLDYAFYHLDGAGQIPHVEHLLGIEKLRGIQWIPGAGQPQGASWPDLLRRIVASGRLIQVHDTADALIGLLDRFERSQWKHFQCIVVEGSSESAVTELLERAKW